MGPLRDNFTGEFRLLSLNIGLLKLIVGLWESMFGVCGENSIYEAERHKPGRRGAPDTPALNQLFPGFSKKIRFFKKK